MLVTKQIFELEALELECGRSIPVRLGYETYGTLNENKDNAILVAHYFSASSHAAGVYSIEDAAPGWWDGLIGEGKAVDTNQYFVICMDNLCNVHAKNPNIVTTGPASMDPKTGKPYAMTFPVVSFADIAASEKALIDSLGIQTLESVMGPSAGGMIAFQWAVRYPMRLKKCIGVITNVQNPVITSFSVLQQAMRAIMLDPNFQDGNYYGSKEPVEGVRLAAQMMTVGAFTPAFMEKTYPRDSQEDAAFLDINHTASYEDTLYQATVNSTMYVDPLSWIYTCRMTMNQDIARGFASLDEALRHIQAKVLMIPCRQDLLQNEKFNEKTVARINELGGYAELYSIDHEKGHMAGVLETGLFEEKVREFLAME